MAVVQAALLGLTAVLLAAQLKPLKPEYAVYLAALFKMAGITYIAEFTSGICKDAGYSAVGTQVEMVGKLAILAVSAPVVLSLVETLKVFME